MVILGVGVISPTGNPWAENEPWETLQKKKKKRMDDM